MAGRFIEKTHYETLGILPLASEREIKHKYRKLALAHHPDKGGDETLFKDIQHAAECLLDPRLRAEYDKTLRKLRVDLFPEVPRAEAEADPNPQPERAKKAPRNAQSDWWFHAMYSEINEIYQESLREQFQFGRERPKPKPFSDPGRRKGTDVARNRFRRPSLERLWMDKGLN